MMTLSIFQLIIVTLAQVANNSNRYKIAPAMDKMRPVANILSLVYSIFYVIVAFYPQYPYNLTNATADEIFSSILYFVYIIMQELSSSFQNFAINHHCGSIRARQNQLAPKVGYRATFFSTHYQGWNLFVFVITPIILCAGSNIFHIFLIEERSYSGKYAYFTGFQ